MNEFAGMILQSGFGRFAMDALWQTSLVAGLTWFCVRFVCRRPASRSWLIAVGVATCIALPMLTSLSRHYRLGLFASPLGPPLTVSDADWSWDEGEIDSDDPLSSNATFGSTSGDVVPALSSPPRAALSSAERPVQRLRGSIQVDGIQVAGLLTGWFFATLLMAFRLFISPWHVLKILRNSTECDDRCLQAAYIDASRRLKLRQAPPPLLESELVSCPSVVSCGRSYVIVPRTHAGDLDWVGVFCHELAHVRRFDSWARLLVQISLVLFPWQPVLWLLRREHIHACEEACDDWAVYAGADPLEYASMLTNWISRRPKEFAMAFAGRGLSLRRRIERLAHAKVHAQPQASLHGSIGGCVAAMLLVGSVPFLHHEGGQTAHAAAPEAQLNEAGFQKPAEIQPDAARPDSFVKTIGSGRMIHSQRSRVLGFDPSGEMLLTTSETLHAASDHRVVFWNLATGESVHWIRHPNRGVALSPDRKRLIIGQRDGSVVVINVQTRSQEYTLAGLSARQVTFSFSADCRRVASISTTDDHKKLVRVWNISDGSVVAEFRMSRTVSHLSLALSCDGSLLAVFDGTSIVVWDVDHHTKLHALSRPDWSPRRTTMSLTFSPDAKLLISMGSPGYVDIWSTDTFEHVGDFQIKYGRKQISMPPSGQRLAVVDNYAVQLWSVPDGQLIWSFPLPQHATSGLGASSAFSPNGKLLAVAVHNHVLLLDTETGLESDSVIASDDEYVSMALHPDGTRLATGTTDGKISIWNLKTSHVQCSWTYHSGAVRRLQYSSDGRVLASAADDRSVALWNPKTGKIFYHLQQSISVMPYFLGFSPDGATLICSCTGAMTNAWDVRSGTKVGNLRGDRSGLRGPLVFSPDGDRLFTVDERAGVSIWDSMTLDRQVTLSKRPASNQLAIDSGGTTLASGYRNQLTTWDVSTQSKIGLYTVRNLNTLAFSPDDQVIASVERSTLKFLDARTGACLRTLKFPEQYGAIRQIECNDSDGCLYTVNSNGTIGVVAL